MPLRRNAIVIFGKRPRAGTVKTRLCPPLNPQQAAKLSASMFRDTFSAAQSVLDSDVIVGYSPDSGRAWFAGEAPGSLLVSQGEGCLGERLLRVQRRVFSMGYDTVALIGSDMPHIRPAVIRHALQTTRRPDEVVVGPARDGGYYLIASTSIHPRLFEEMPWGHHSLLERTLSAARSLDLHVELLPYARDIDGPDDLRWLLARPKPARLRHTFEALRAMGLVRP